MKTKKLYLTLLTIVIMFMTTNAQTSDSCLNNLWVIDSSYQIDNSYIDYVTMDYNIQFSENYAIESFPYPEIVVTANIYKICIQNNNIIFYAPGDEILRNWEIKELSNSQLVINWRIGPYKDIILHFKNYKYIELDLVSLEK